MWITCPTVERSEDISQVFVAVLSDCHLMALSFLSYSGWIQNIKLMKFIDSCAVDQTHLHWQKSSKVTDDKSCFQGTFSKASKKIGSPNSAT